MNKLDDIREISYEDMLFDAEKILKIIDESRELICPEIKEDILELALDYAIPLIEALIEIDKEDIEN